MIKSIKTWILVGFASLLLVACGQSGGGAGSKKSKTLENDLNNLGSSKKHLQTFKRTTSRLIELTQKIR